MAHRLRGKVLAFIRSQRVARLATVGANRTLHNVAICPVVLSSKIYFASAGDARKVRNLLRNPRVTLAFDHYSENWKHLAGVMIVGRSAVSTQGAVFRRARQALYRKYRQYARSAPITEGESVIVCVTPSTSFSWGL